MNGKKEKNEQDMDFIMNNIDLHTFGFIFIYTEENGSFRMDKFILNI